MERVATRSGISERADRCAQPSRRATETKRMSAHVFAVAASAVLLAGCAASGTGETTQPSGQSPSTRPAPTAQEPPPSLKDACFSTDGVKGRSMWFKASDGVRLYGVESGTGGTAVVLAHEGGADLCGWLSYMKTLNRAGIRAFAFDFRGYGNSDRPETARLALGRVLAGGVDGWCRRSPEQRRHPCGRVDQFVGDTALVRVWDQRPEGRPEPVRPVPVRGLPAGHARTSQGGAVHLRQRGFSRQADRALPRGSPRNDVGGTATLRRPDSRTDPGVDRDAKLRDGS